MNHIHISYDLVDHFELRIPPDRAPGEDDITPRICTAPDIRSGLAAMPGGGYTAFQMVNIGLPVVVHAYYLDCEKVIDDVSDKVPDWNVTHEQWCMSEPRKVVRRDYELSDIVFQDAKDCTGKMRKYILLATIKRVKNQDNWENLFKLWEISYLFEDDVGIEIKKQVSFRKFIGNYEEVMEKWMNRKKKL